MPELRSLYHVPNGGHRAKATGAALSRQGLKAGVPDMSLDVPARGFAGLRIELKRYREGHVGDEQRVWLARLAGSGYRAVVCWGWVAAWEEILWYLGREDLLLPAGRVTTRLTHEHPADPFWQRSKIAAICRGNKEYGLWYGKLT